MNERYGKLVILEPTSKRKNNYIVYKCLCDCGNIVYRTKSSLVSSMKSSSKGAACDKCSKKRQATAVTKHGMTTINPRLHRICYGAKRRCENPKDKNYSNYGSRGIEFKFDSVEHMFNWSLENGYSDNLTIDRIDNNGHYEPSNCRWVDINTQANNKRDSQELNGVVGLNNIAKYLNISYRRLSNMIYRDKLSLEEIYEKSKTDPLFYATNTERRALAQRKRSDEWAIPKDEAIKIVENIKNGSSINKESKRLNVDFITVKRAIKRLEDGIYDL